MQSLVFLKMMAAKVGPQHWWGWLSRGHGEGQMCSCYQCEKNHRSALGRSVRFFLICLEIWIPFAAPRPEGSITEGTCAGTEKLGQLQIGSSMIDASIFSHRWDNGIRHQPSKQVITGRISKTGWIWHICQRKLTLIYCIPCWMTEESCSLSSLRATAYQCLQQHAFGRALNLTITRMFAVTWNGMCW